MNILVDEKIIYKKRGLGMFVQRGSGFKKSGRSVRGNFISSMWRR